MGNQHRCRGCGRFMDPDNYVTYGFAEFHKKCKEKAGLKGDGWDES